MVILRTVEECRSWCEAQHSQGKSLGLVPTMGALHPGHLSLAQRALAENDAVVASVFVNPTQFNNPEDLATYPRTEEADFALLEEAGVHAVFAPTAEEIYPETQTSDHLYDLGEVAEVMEGAMRPGHFQGVAQIVDKLIRLTAPTRAYFGKKDFQQIAVIRRMVSTEGLDLEIVACPIVRENDGLALSSRNVRLSESQRKVAPAIHRTLKESLSASKHDTPAQVIKSVTDSLNALPECEVEYFSIVNAETLQAIDKWEDAPHAVGCITVYVGPVRLIDNIEFF